MAARAFPATSEAFADATWEDIRPYFEELAGRELNENTFDSWLADWSLLTELVAEAFALAMFAYSGDTADPAKEAANLRFAADIMPKVNEQTVRLSARMLDAGLSRPGLETMLRQFRNQRELFREENVALLSQLEELSSEHQKLTGGLMAEWEGKKLPIPQLEPYLEVEDRDVRERAFRATYEPYIDSWDRLHSIFDRMLALRAEVARNAGFDNYRDFAHREKNRFDYTPGDCLRWHDAVRQTFVPAVARLRQRRRKKLGLDSLRPWDLGNDADGLPPLRPFRGGRDLIEKSGRAFDRLDPRLAAQFRQMDAARLLDLDSRAGKAPGGFCEDLPAKKLALIFMNAAGTQRDVEVLFHESGHCFHAFAYFHIEPYFHRFPGAEMAEVASMSMELLSAPHWAQPGGGFYSEEEARRARSALLEGILEAIPHIATVDAFQHWLYTSPEAADHEKRDQEWLRIRAEFDQVTEWSGLEAQRIARWHLQLHFFGYPFYYIEYGLAQLAALQVWRNSLRDPQAALDSYLGALSLGGTRPLPELYAAAGARLMFDADGMQELVTLVESELEKLQG